MMYNNFSYFGGFAIWHGLGMLFGLIFLIGLILIISWAIKTHNKDQLLKWSISLIIIGIIGWFLIMSFSGLRYGSSVFSGKYGYGMMNPYSWNCTQDNK